MGIRNKLSRFISHRITFWAVVFTAIIDIGVQGANNHWVMCGILGGVLFIWVWLGKEHLRRKHEN